MSEIITIVPSSPGHITFEDSMKSKSNLFWIGFELGILIGMVLGAICIFI
jgi:hypothetical protein